MCGFVLVWFRPALIYGMPQARLNVPRPSVPAWSASSSPVLLPAAHISLRRSPSHISFPEPPVRVFGSPRLLVPLFAVGMVVCLRGATSLGFAGWRLRLLPSMSSGLSDACTRRLLTVPILGKRWGMRPH